MKPLIIVGACAIGLGACGNSPSSTDDGAPPADTSTSDSPGPTDAPDPDDWCARNPSYCDDAPPSDPCDMDGDGAQAPECGGDDCDDHDVGIYPGRAEYPCDGIDQNCDGRDYCQPDADMDGWPACEPGETGMGCDCNDGDPGINPGVAEIPCDGVDQNCWPADDCVHETDADGDGYYACRSDGPAFCDCSDASRDIHPDAPEITCDGVDNNCSGADCCDQDDDMDGYACREDCDDTDQYVYPGACGSSYPPKDFNCDGVIDARDSCDGSAPGGL